MDGYYGEPRDRTTFILCLLYTSDAADERSSVDLGGRRIIKKKNKRINVVGQIKSKNKTRSKKKR